jgi:hypothetical protein
MLFIQIFVPEGRQTNISRRDTEQEKSGYTTKELTLQDTVRTGPPPQFADSSSLLVFEMVDASISFLRWLGLAVGSDVKRETYTYSIRGNCSAIESQVQDWFQRHASIFQALQWNSSISRATPGALHE